MDELLDAWIAFCKTLTYPPSIPLHSTVQLLSGAPTLAVTVGIRDAVSALHRGQKL